MIDHAKFPQLATPMVDSSGNITQEWRRLLNDMWTLAGGGAVASLSANFVPPTQLGTAASVLYTSTTYKTSIDAAVASNPSGASQKITVYLVPSGRSADATTEVLPPLAIAAGTSVELSSLLGQILEKGATVQALADAGNAIVLSMSGTQITTS